MGWRVGLKQRVENPQIFVGCHSFVERLWPELSAPFQSSFSPFGLRRWAGGWPSLAHEALNPIMPAVPSLLSNHDWEPKIDCRTYPWCWSMKEKWTETPHQELMAKWKTEASKQVLILAACGVCSITVCWAPCQALGMGGIQIRPCSRGACPPLLRFPLSTCSAQLEAFPTAQASLGGGMARELTHRSSPKPMKGGNWCTHPSFLTPSGGTTPRSVLHHLSTGD